MGRPPVKSNATFLGIFENAITEKVVKDDEGNYPKGSITRAIENGQKHEFQYPYWEGIITNIKYHEHEYEGKMIKSWNVFITDEEDEEFILSVSFASGYSNSFYKKARNIVFAEPVKIVPYCFEDENGKTKKGLNFYANGSKDNKVANYWDKDNLPKAVKKTDRKTKKEVWDFSKVNEKLEEDFIEVIESAFSTDNGNVHPSEMDAPAVGYSTPTQTENSQGVDEDTGEVIDKVIEGDSDLPF